MAKRLRIVLPKRDKRLQTGWEGFFPYDDPATRPEQLDVLRAYTAGRIGARSAIEALGARDYADLIIAQAQNDLDFPRPSASPALEARVSRARRDSATLLRRGG